MNLTTKTLNNNCRNEFVVVDIFFGVEEKKKQIYRIYIILLLTIVFHIYIVCFFFVYA